MQANAFSIFDNLIEGVQVLDRQYNYVYVNEAVAKHAKEKIATLQGQNMLEKYPGIEQTPMFAQLKACMEKGTYQQMENEFDFPDGSKGYFELRMQKIPEGVLMMSFDITEVVRAKKVLEDRQISLELDAIEKHQQIEEQRELIKSQMEALKDASATKDRFMGIIAHDLRSPLNNLFGFAELLIQGVGGMSSDDLKQLGKELKIAVNSSIKLLDNLFVWAQVQMGKITAEQEETALAPAIKAVVDLYQNAANLKKIEIQVAVPNALVAWVDHDQLAFIVRNLVNNAIKFTPNQGSVCIKAYEVSDTNQVAIEVSDTGSGLNPKELQDIFHSKQRKSKYGTNGETGTGLGLILVQEFVALNKGELSVEKLPEKGSCFKILLPSAVAE